MHQCKDVRAADEEKRVLESAVMENSLIIEVNAQLQHAVNSQLIQKQQIR